MNDFIYFKKIAKKDENGETYKKKDFSDLKEGFYDLLGSNGKIYGKKNFTRDYNIDKNDLSVGVFFVVHPSNVEIVAYRESEV